MHIDWYQRDGETYVVKNRSIYLEAKRKERAEALLYQKLTRQQALDKAYDMSWTFLTAMKLTDTAVVISKRAASYTDGQTIVVSTSFFDKEELEVSFLVTAFIGLVIHEGCHILYSDFLAGSKIKEKYSNNEFAVIKAIANILEDERIETAFLNSFPGYYHYLVATKKLYFSALHIPEKPTVLTQFLAVVRFPDLLDAAYLSEREELFSKLKDVCTPMPETCEAVWEVAEKVYELIKEEAEKEKRSKKDSSEGESEEGESEEGESEEGESEESPNSEEASDIAQLIDMLESMSESELKTILKSVVAELSASIKDTGESSIEDPSSIEETAYLENPEQGEVVNNGKVRWQTATVDIHKYTKAKNNVNKYIELVQKPLRTKFHNGEVVHKGMRTGTLDEYKIVEAIQGATAIYQKRIHKKAKPIDVVVLVDESGSMSGHTSLGEGIDKIELARRFTILLDLAMTGIKDLTYFVYGHTADEEGTQLSMRIYKEPGISNKYLLGSLRARCNNRDGHAIREVAKRVRTFSKNKCILFVISDGHPAAYYYDGFEDTRRAVKEVTSEGFIPIQLAVDAVNSSKMFKHWVDLTKGDRLFLSKFQKVVTDNITANIEYE